MSRGSHYIPGNAYSVPFPVCIRYCRCSGISPEYGWSCVATQAICLEEMFHTIIPYGYLYYGKTRRRTEIVFTEVLRKRVSDLVSEMYRLFELGITPPAVCGSYCRSCSLVDVCLPEMMDGRISVSEYMNRMFSEERHEKAT